MYLLGYHKDVKPDKYIIELIHSDEFKVLMNDFESVVEIIDTSINYIKFDNFVLAKAREHGEIEYKEQITTDGKKLKIFTKYIENDDKQRVLFIVDHIALVKTISGQSKKGMIDEMADIMIKARNRYRFSFGITQQLNRSFASTDRKKLEDMLPKDGDLVI